VKANEYYQQFLTSVNDDPSQTLSAIFIEFNREMGKLMKQRGIKTDDGLPSLFLEMEQKWKAFCNLLLQNKEYEAFESISTLFRRFWFEELPEMEALLMRHERGIRRV
jgi:hypothetical protein